MQFRGILIVYVFCISSNSKAKMEFETKVVACEDIQEIKKSRVQLKVAMSLQVQLYFRQHPFLKDSVLRLPFSE